MAFAVALHLTCTAAALVLGGIILLRTKGTPSHRLLGRLWATLMAGAALSSLWIPSFLKLSWIHFFVIVVAVCVPRGIVEIRRGRVRSHRGWMIGTFIGLIGAGLGTLAPGRLIGDALRMVLGWH